MANATTQHLQLYLMLKFYLKNSKVTWVEHNAECKGTGHSMLKGLLESGVAYNARRWMATLERQCDRIATSEARDDSLSDKGPEAARSGLLKLAERMIGHFHFIFFSNMEGAWRAVSLFGDDILIKTSFILDDLQIPPRVTVSIAMSVWLPVRQIRVFNFLRKEHNRNKSCSQEGEITYLQESYTHSVACYVGYAPIDVPTMHRLLQRGTADFMAILPSRLYYLMGPRIRSVSSPSHFRSLMNN